MLAIISTMSDGMLRVSELCSLVIEDVTFEPDGSGTSHYPDLRKPTKKAREPCNTLGSLP